MKFTFEKHPTPADILLIIEISDTTLGDDRDAKAPRLSPTESSNISLLNLQNETIEDSPPTAEDGYGSNTLCRKGDSFNLVAFPEIEIKLMICFRKSL